LNTLVRKPSIRGLYQQLPLRTVAKLSQPSPRNGPVKVHFNLGKPLHRALVSGSCLPKVAAKASNAPPQQLGERSGHSMSTQRLQLSGCGRSGSQSFASQPQRCCAP
jgi:hypothetical protein